jgi:hypothetical protein
MSSRFFLYKRDIMKLEKSREQALSRIEKAKAEAKSCAEMG